MNTIGHTPVLVNEVISTFETVHPNHWVVDCTLGRGGHFLELLKSKDKLVGIDADGESVSYVEDVIRNKFELLEESSLDKQIKNLKFKVKNSKKSIWLVNDNFTNIDSILKRLEIEKAGGILADLGVSTFQIKNSERGFSFEKKNEILDMRIDPNQGPQAKDLLNALSTAELAELFESFGEISNSKSYARKIVDYRKTNKILTVGDLLNALNIREGQKRGRIHPATKVFMALRIAVNNEFANLKRFLENSNELLNGGSLLSVITFHSLEEKIVKEFIKKNNYGFKVVVPDSTEVKNNPSSRSAKLFKVFKN